MELLRNVPTERLDLPGGHWVDLKTRLTVAERKRLTTAAFGIANVQDDPTPSIDLAAITLVALEIGIVAWSLDEAVTAEAVRLLDEDSGDLIAKELDRLWAQRTDDERKNSSGGGPTTALRAPRPRPS